MKNMDSNMSFDVPTSNRFQILQERENDNMTMDYSADITRRDFIQSSAEDKLVHIFDELRIVRNEQIGCSRGILSLQEAFVNINNKVGQVIDTTNAQTEFLRTLAYKSIDSEARSRRNNLIFRGFAENMGENCFDIIGDFLENRLDMDRRDVYMTRAHRLGARNQNKRLQSRPIIVNFRDFGDTEYILSRAKMLKDTPFSIDIDLPREIQQARSRLWPKYKDYKRNNPRSKVMIAYPAKLIMDHKLIHDEMPEWNMYINKSRLPNLELIDQKESAAVQQEPPHRRLTEVYTYPQPPTYDNTVKEIGLPAQRGPTSQPSMNQNKVPQSCTYPDVSPIGPGAYEGQNILTSSQFSTHVNVSPIRGPVFENPPPVSFLGPSHLNAPMAVTTNSASQNVSTDVNVQTPYNNSFVTLLSENIFSPKPLSSPHTVTSTSQPVTSENTPVFLNLDTQSVTTGTETVTLNNGPVVHIPSSQSNVNTSDTNTGHVMGNPVLPERGRARISRANSRTDRRLYSASPYRRSDSTTQTGDRFSSVTKNSQGKVNSGSTQLSNNSTVINTGENHGH